MAQRDPDLAPYAALLDVALSASSEGVWTQAAARLIGDASPARPTLHGAKLALPREATEALYGRLRAGVTTGSLPVQPDLHLLRNALTLQPTEGPLGAILQEVARTLDIKITVSEEVSGPTSVCFAGLPMEEGLRRLLEGQSFIFLYHETRLAELRLVTARPLRKARGNREGLVDSISDEARRFLDLEGALAQGRDEDYETLIQATADPDPAISLLAFRGLAQWNPVETIALATATSRDPDLARRLTGLQALGGLDDPLAVQTLGEALTDSDVGVREYSVRGLAGQTSPGAVLILSQALEDRVPSIRLLALNAIAQKGVEGQAAIQFALNTTGDPLVRSRAIELLEQMRAEQDSTLTEGPL